MTFAPGDLVRFKARKGLGHPWVLGRVTALHPHQATIQPARGGGASLTVPLCRVRPAGLQDVAGLPHRVQFDPSGAGALPALAAVVPRTTGGGALRAVPKDPPPFRSAAYRAWVRSHRCCNRVCPTPEARIEAHHDGGHGVGELACDSTCVPLCVPCHRAVTDAYAVPGLSRAETERLFDQVAVRLMAQWVVRAEAQTVVVPLLRLVAAVLLFLLLPAHAAAAQADPAPRPIGVGAVVLWGLGLVLLAWAALRRRPAPPPVLRPDPLSVPTDADLLCIVHRRERGATLAEICAHLWPFLSWSPAFEGEPSATTGAQRWPCHPPIATPADWVRDRMTVLSARGAVRLVSRPGRGPAALRWVACRSSGALLLGLGLSVQAGCTADTLTSAGVALLAGLGALAQGWRHWRAVRGVVEQHDRRIGRLELQARRSAPQRAKAGSLTREVADGA